MNIDQILDNIWKLSAESKEKLKSNIEQVNFSKGVVLVKAGKIEKDVYFMKKGIARAYVEQENNEVTICFLAEGETAISMRSYVSGEKGYENIELLENSELYRLATHNLQKLFLEDVQIANWGRKFAEQELIKTEERFISGQFRTATERYVELLQNNPRLIQRVQLGYIASYLGITQVTLSRIRASIK